MDEVYGSQTETDLHFMYFDREWHNKLRAGETVKVDVEKGLCGAFIDRLLHDHKNLKSTEFEDHDTYQRYTIVPNS